MAQKQKLEQQLWNIANELRGKMDADEFRDYILGFIFYKYLSEKQHLFANKLLETEKLKNYTLVNDEEDIAAIKAESLEKLGYFLRAENDAKRTLNTTQAGQQYDEAGQLVMEAR